MFPFDRPKDYGEMLNKIALFTFFVALGLTWFVGRTVPWINDVLNTRAITFDVASLKVPILYVIVAGTVALLSRIIKLHDRISDVFKIRERFDVDKILIPLFVAANLKVDAKIRSQLKANRGALMERVFYAYASFEDPKISKALVLGAVEVWTWYWIMLEAALLFFLASLILFFSQAYVQAWSILAISLGLILIFPTVFITCGRRARDQIEEIMSDGARLNAIKSELSKFAAEQ